ncbi:hypothetical protein ACFL3D_05680 [Candidatus Omnitrophota bacterium]
MEDNPSRKERRERVREEDRSFEELKSEKRKYTRTTLHGNVDFMTCDATLLHESANIENVSQFGILFKTKRSPQVGSIIALHLDPEQVSAIVHINELFREENGDILGRIVRVEVSKESDEYDVAVNLFRKGF